MVTQRAPTSLTSFYSSPELKYVITPSALNQTQRVSSSLLNPKINFGSFTGNSVRTRQIRSCPSAVLLRRYDRFTKALTSNQEIPQPSSNSKSRYTYDVFLSFRGEDTRKNFVDHLHHALHLRGITTFRDDSDHDLPRGKAISPELIRAIEESRYVIVIFSENYASSTWCLEEVAKIVECKDINGGSVIPIFYKVNPSDIRKIKGNFQRALAIHEEKHKDNLKRLEKWKTALNIVASLSGRELSDGYESQFIEQVVKEIENRLGHRFSYVANNLVGIESSVAEVVKQLCLGENDVRSIGIWGMGGIGKTTTARVVYNSIRSQFEGGSFLANVRETSEKNGLIHIQNQLLHDFLIDNNLSIEDVEKGATMIKERLQYKKVILVLDDVDKRMQLEKLAGGLDWFGHGSRIIVTTRDIHLLQQHGVNYIYKLKGLANEEALKLFSLKAFKCNHPPNEFSLLSHQVVKYTNGLPLALDVLGSFLFGKSLTEWQSALDRLKECPDKEIFYQLKISYDGLQEKEKEIFLDIACFFKGKDKKRVMEILESCGLYPEIGIRVLLDRSLITVVGNTLQMHDLLQEMGWEIVRQESPTEPGKRSRVWLFKDIRDILTKKSGSPNIKGIVLQSDVKIEASGESFTNMTNLRLLYVRGIHLSSGFKHLSNELCHLTWDYCSLESFPPSFISQNLEELNMHDSFLTKLWTGEKVFEKLKFIDLSHSKLFIETPNFRHVPNLERLILKDCRGLHQVHPSIGVLQKLTLLDLSGCDNLKSLPKSIGNLRSLKVLNLSGCSNLEKLPESISLLKCLEELDISPTAIIRLLPGLAFPKNLKTLRLKGWKGQPAKFWRRLMLSLRSILNSRGSRLPSFSGLSQLVELDMSRCNLQEGEIPSDIGCLSSLRTLDVSRNNFTTLPASICRIPGLESLRMEHCKSLEVLPRLPESIKFLGIYGCLKLKRISNPFIIRTWFTECFRFENCFSLLPQDIVLTLEEKYYLSSLRSTILSFETHDHSIYMVSPSEYGIPRWFNYQTNGSFLRMKMPSPWWNRHWRGFVICASFQRQDGGSFGGLKYPLILSCDFYVDRCRLASRVEFSVRYIDSGYVWLGCALRSDFPIATKWKAMKTSSHISVKLRISDYRLRIEKCAAHLIYKHHTEHLYDFLVRWARSSR